MKDTFKLVPFCIAIGLLGIVLIISISMSAYNNISAFDMEKELDSLSQEVKQLRYEMDSINNDLLNMF